MRLRITASGRTEREARGRAHRHRLPLIRTKSIKEKCNMSIQPFQVNVPQATLDDLHERLARTRWPDEVEGAGWDYGTNLQYMKELIDYWQHTFDWRAQEARLNHFAQFRTQIDGIHIHFVHERARQGSGIPLILTHGWPSSFIELLP